MKRVASGAGDLDSGADVEAVPVMPINDSSSVPPTPRKVPLFGARAMARELMADVQRLTEELNGLQATMSRLGVMDAAALERHRDSLTNEISVQETRLRQAAAEHEAKLKREQEAANQEVAVLRQQQTELQQRDCQILCVSGRDGH